MLKYIKGQHVIITKRNKYSSYTGEAILTSHGGPSSLMPGDIVYTFIPYSNYRDMPDLTFESCLAPFIDVSVPFAMPKKAI